MVVSRSLVRTVATLLGLAVSAPAFAPALAHGGPSSAPASGATAAPSSGPSTSAPAAGTSAPPPCPAGFVRKQGSCLHAKAGVLPDADLYAMGRALALAGHYREALPILEAVSRRDDAMVYTMRGYATRKLGDPTRAMALYDTALAIEPNNVNTHEYVGEAYVVMGKRALARVELATVRRLCGGTGCEQYEDLARAIDTGETE